MSTSSGRESQLTRALKTLGVSVMLAAGLSGDMRLSGQTTFRAGSAGVIVDVVARDRRHKPITDLRREEFQVFEDGRLQHVTYFARIDAARLSGAVATAPEAVSPTSVDVAQRPAAKIALAFEQLSPEGRQMAAAGARHFLEHGVRPEDLVSVFAIDRALHVLVPYTRDRAALTHGIDQAAVRAGYPLEQAGRTPGAEWRAGQSASDATIAESPYVRAHATIDALRGLVRSLRAPEGRRAVVLFSEGLALGKPKDSPVNPSVSPHDRESWLYDNRFDALDRLTKEAGREGVTFYTFDARGLRVADDPGGFGEAPYIGLKFLADETGGDFVQASNDLAPALQRLAADLQSYYLLGYTSAKAPDRQYRHITVKVVRRDVTVLARRGYIADDSRR